MSKETEAKPNDPVESMGLFGGKPIADKTEIEEDGVTYVADIDLAKIRGEKPPNATSEPEETKGDLNEML